ncbi:related to high-affinity iron transporter FtrA [Cephalotrichum gorgonifer]|uniref:Related to high-affinity iron transporter FtrA n=1 Tax=Cephalotrichum gorgonifer TaxID=2041049 RepID=A0AAE8N751_9PEZI|nr:related to high-affinity iron transporter FtrA [Cephalotrichum gorgonifer]
MLQSSLFSVPIFFISLREALEAGIIVSVLLAILDKAPTSTEDAALHKSLVRQVWLGTFLGVFTCLTMGTIIIGGFYGLAAEAMGSAESIWEAVFSLVASVAITVMGAVLLRVGKLQDTWRAKLARAVEAESDANSNPSNTFLGRFSNVGNKYGLMMLPFITILREGFEGILFIGGVIVGSPVSSIPLSILVGMVVGVSISYLIYRGRNAASIRFFLLLSTGLLYLIAAGLFSKGVWHLEAYQWNMIVGGDAAELGSGPGSYDIRRSVWHVNCCNPSLDGGGIWGIFNAVLGWQNSATVGSVVSYNVYWIVVALGFLVAIRKDRGQARTKAAAVANGDPREP